MATCLVADALRLVLTLLVGLAWDAGAAPPLPILYGLAFVIAAAGAFFNPARAAAVPALLPRDLLVSASALDGLSGGLTLTVTWALSGVIVAAVGPAGGLLLNAGSFLVSFLLVHAAPWSQTTPSDVRPAGCPLAELREGVCWARADGLVRIVLAAQLIDALAAGCFVAALAPFLQRELHGGAALYGLQGAVFGAGLVAASWYIGATSLRRVGLLYAVGLAVNGLGNSLFALAPAAGWLLPPVFVAGLGRTANAVGQRTMLQIYVPARVRARVFALSGALASTVVLPAFALGGWLADAWVPRWVVLGPSLVHLALGLGLVALERVRAAHIAPDRQPARGADRGL